MQYCQAVLPALFVCAMIFVKIVLSVVATPLPPVSGSICLPGLTAPHSAALGFLCLMPALAARPSQQRPMTQQPAQSTSFWGLRGRVLLSRRSEPRALGKRTLHDTALPSLHQTKGPVFPNWAALVHVPNGPSRVPHPFSGARAPSPKPCSVHLSILCAPLCSDSPGRAASNSL